MRIRKKQNRRGCNISEAHPQKFQKTTTFCITFIRPDGDYSEQVSGFGGVDGAITFTYVKASYPWGKEKLKKKMMDQRQFRQAWDYILVQRLALVEEGRVCNYSQRRTLTRRLENVVYGTTTMYLSQNVGDLTPLKNFTKPTLYIGA